MKSETKLETYYFLKCIAKSLPRFLIINNVTYEQGAKILKTLRYSAENGLVSENFNFSVKKTIDVDTANPEFIFTKGSFDDMFKCRKEIETKYFSTLYDKDAWVCDHKKTLKTFE